MGKEQFRAVDTHCSILREKFQATHAKSADSSPVEGQVRGVLNWGSPMTTARRPCSVSWWPFCKYLSPFKVCAFWDLMKTNCGRNAPSLHYVRLEWCLLGLPDVGRSVPCAVTNPHFNPLVSEICVR
jgi:hypothetical protein